jgi:protein-S-isoprenylcysteine O-methyltransferase Ste14
MRHPGYLGGLLCYLATPFLLESLWAFVPVVLMTVVIVLRTSLEDKTLQEKLGGYREYAQKVRYRLISGIW